MKELPSKEQRLKVAILLYLSAVFFALALVSSNQPGDELAFSILAFISFARAAWLILIRGVRWRQNNN